MINKELWCVGIRPEDDSPHEQCPAVTKEIADRAVARYKAMTLAEGNELLIESFDDFVQVQQWEGSEKEHTDQMLYIEDWFKEPMYQCRNMAGAEMVFRYGEIVECFNDGVSLITTDFELAKRFYEGCIMDIQAKHKLFEERALNNGSSDESSLIKNEDGTYKNLLMQSVFEVFCTGIDVAEELFAHAKQIQAARFVLVPKLSANYLFNKVPELGFKHKDEEDTVLYHLNYMASEFKDSAKQFVNADHAKQTEPVSTGEKS